MTVDRKVAWLYCSDFESSSCCSSCHDEVEGYEELGYLYLDDLRRVRGSGQRKKRQFIARICCEVSRWASETGDRKAWAIALRRWRARERNRLETTPANLLQCLDSHG